MCTRTNSKMQHKYVTSSSPYLSLLNYSSQQRPQPHSQPPPKSISNLFKLLIMSLPTRLESDPRLVPFATATSFQASPASPNDNQSNRLSRSTTLQDIRTTPLQSTVQARSPSQLESNTENLVDISGRPIGIRLLQLHQASLRLIVVQVILLFGVYVAFILILRRLN
jgi:hypothetical protein